ncbi:MAG: tryptophan synthase subunit alpha [Candidatus Peregrinibacteria bacterium]|nr:tryptophan synthase subunit alpha [Candidatus Peregrinibacteria bacterium]
MTTKPTKTCSPLMPFTVIGDPSFKTSLKIVKTFAESGAYAIELGFPFSDPTADGPTIQAADNRALKAGITPKSVIEFIKESRKFTNLPIGLLAYYNPILQYGVEKFYREAAKAGLTSILITDLPPEEASEACQYAKHHGLHQIFVVSSLTTPKRLKIILKNASGFLYVVSKPGVTGTKTDLANETIQTIKRLKKQTQLPLYVGFGISESKHVREVVKAGADCAIVGSALVKMIEENLKTQSRIPEIMEKKIRKLIN